MSILIRLSFLASVVAAAGLSAQSKLDLDKLVKVKEWGYGIRPIKSWTSIPAKQDEKLVVGQWKQDLAELRKRGDYEGWQSGQYCNLSIVRIAKATTTGGAAAPPADGAKAKPEKEKTPVLPPEMLARLEKQNNPKSIEDYLEGHFEGAAMRWTRKPIKAGKLTGELLEFGAGAEAISCAIFKQAEAEWGVLYRSFEESYRKTWQDLYLRSIESFVLFDAANRDTIAARKDPKELKGDAKRDALKATVAGLPGWYTIDTKYYVFLSNASDKAYVQALAKEIEMLRERVYVKLFPPRNEEESISPVRVLDNQSEYHQYGGPGGSAGYFSPDSGELVLFTKFEDVTKKNSLAYCRSVMYHEAFHQYVHYAIGDVSPHSWFNEGHGDYFAGAVVSGASIRFQPFDWRVDFLKDHLRNKRDLIPVRTLVRLPQSEYYTNAGLKYAQGWALIYYLRSVSKDKKHQRVLDTYFSHIADNIEAFRKKKKEEKDKDGEDKSGPAIPGIPGIKIFNYEDRQKVEKILAEAVTKAFDGIDLEQLDVEFRAWIQKL